MWNPLPVGNIIRKVEVHPPQFDAKMRRTSNHLVHKHRDSTAHPPILSTNMLCNHQIEHPPLRLFTFIGLSSYFVASRPPRLSTKGFACSGIKMQI
jgi:hypothetical protein